MIFVFEDDGTLSVLASIDEVRREYEGIDVENGAYDFYAENGARLWPDFTEPNERGTILFGLIKTVVSGEYSLVPGVSGDAASFKQKLAALVSGINENEWFSSLDEVKVRFGVIGK